MGFWHSLDSVDMGFRVVDSDYSLRLIAPVPHLIFSSFRTSSPNIVYHRVLSLRFYSSHFFTVTSTMKNHCILLMSYSDLFFSGLHLGFLHVYFCIQWIRIYSNKTPLNKIRGAMSCSEETLVLLLLILYRASKHSPQWEVKVPDSLFSNVYLFFLFRKLCSRHWSHGCWRQ